MSKKMLRSVFTSLLCMCVFGSLVSCKNEGGKDKGYSSVKASSTVSSFDTTGYVAEMLYGNIDEWTVNALKNNPGIIDQIAQGPEGTYIMDIVTDSAGYYKNGFMKIAAEKDHGYKGQRSLMITVFKKGTEQDIEFDTSKLENVQRGVGTNGGLGFYADASDFGDDESLIGLGFVEKGKTADGIYDGSILKWGLAPGGKYNYYDEADKVWKEAETVSSAAKTNNKGRIVLPAGFKGWVFIPYVEGNFQVFSPKGEKIDRYCPETADKFIIAVESTVKKLSRSVYFSSFDLYEGLADDKGPRPLRHANDTIDSIRLPKWYLPLDELQLGESNNKGGWDMTVWFNEYAGKLLTGVSLQYAAKNSQELKKAGDDITDGLAQAQKDDGYLGIYDDDHKLGNNGSWDVWGHYHLIYGLITWYRTTGNEKALEVAKKASDCVYNYFMGSGKTVDSVGNQTMNLAVCHSFAELYKETKDKKYLDAAEKIVNEEWPLSGNWMNLALEGKEFYETPLPRWEALHSILALGTLFEITGKKDYYDAFEKLWWSILKTDRHNTGGFSSTEQAQGDPYAEGSIETCCTVAWQAYSSMYLQFCRNSLVADELELTYLNGMIGSLLDGEYFTTYNTPMGGKTRESSIATAIAGDPKFTFFSGAKDFTCCQANISRGIGEVTSWAVMTDNEGVYLNYYGEGSITAKTPGDAVITFKQETQYPLNGAIAITLSKLEKEEEFDLLLRVPSWARSATVKVNGEEITGAAPGEYFKMSREWKENDMIELSLDFGFHYWINEKDTRLVSVYYGPILLTCSSGDGLRFASRDYFTVQNFNDAQISMANDGMHWMKFTVTCEQGTFEFFDFASFGKFKVYKTWIRVGGTPDAVEQRSFKKPIWANQ